VKHKEVQQIVFRKQIQIALDMNKPLVIHCREAEEDALTILDEVGFYVMLIAFIGNIAINIYGGRDSLV
jgi:Tat protein secretion system quality control protein TatD with DNase activity